MHAVRHASAAFGLIALLVVLLIVLVLYFGNVGGGGYVQQAAQSRERARELAFRIDTRSLTQSILAHRTSTGRLPASFQDMELPPSVWTDPWGQPLTFRIDQARSIVTYHSAGPDGVAGTDDDITAEDHLPL